MKSLHILLISIILNACGTDEETESLEATEIQEIQETEAQYTSYHFKEKSSLGECNQDRDNWLAFISDLKEFYACDGSEWFKVDITDQNKTSRIVESQDSGITWVEKSSGITWELLSNSKGHPYTDNVSWQYICEINGLKTPDRTEIERAAKNGMWVNLMNPNTDDIGYWVWAEDNEDRKKGFDRRAVLYNVKQHYVMENMEVHVVDTNNSDWNEVYTVNGYDEVNIEVGNGIGYVVCKR